MNHWGKFVVLVAAGGLALAACSSSKADIASPGATTTTAAARAVTSTTSPWFDDAHPFSTRQLDANSVKVENAALAAQPKGTQHLHLRYGPLTIQPGQNNIQTDTRNIPQPEGDGWVLRIAPSLRYENGTVPPVDVIHLHHGVWLSFGHTDATSPGLPERFFAAGEEKTTSEMPPGYGYHYSARDHWVLNYMLHNLTSQTTKVYITYDVDFLPSSAPAASSIKPAHPIWMDVQNGSIYPVFDVIKGSGNGKTYTYPDDATDPYGKAAPKNVWTVPQDMTLLATGGHLHPGGLHDDLYVDRGADSSHVFSSVTHYYEPAGAVSWDVSMGVTNPDWHVAVRKGDKLRISTTYDSQRASWYESMGIMVIWAAYGTDAPADATDPFTAKVDLSSHLTHGHLPENDHHGGGADAGYTDPAKLTPTTATGKIDIKDFLYAAGDLSQSKTIPTVKQGSSLTFTNLDAPIGVGIWHSITACKEPCTGETGIAYPLADAAIPFDSGQLSNRGLGAPTAGRPDWSTPKDLPVGTYAYFCRIHPYMRGAFTVIK